MSTWSKSFGEFIYHTSYSGPEITRLTEDGIDLVRKFNLNDVISQGDYFHDFSRNRLYVYSNAEIPGVFNPKGNGKTYVAYFWVCLSNVQSQENPLTFTPQIGTTYGGTIDCEYQPFLDSGSENSVTVNISQQYQDSVKMQFGTIKANNGAHWYEKKDRWIFKNGEIYLKVGALSDSYSDFENVFAGKLAEPVFSDNGISISCQDKRYGILKSIPPEKFSIINHPAMDEEFIDAPVPILFGIKTDIKPARISEYTVTDQWSAGGGDFETWVDAVTPYYWRSIIGGTSTVNRDGVNQRTGTYCARLDIDASNSTAAIRTLTQSTDPWFDYADGVWLNRNCGYALLFYYYNSVAAKTAEWSLIIEIDGVIYYWDNSNKKWTTSSMFNPLPNVLSYTLLAESFYLPEAAGQYNSEETGMQYPLYFRIQNDSAASSSIYIDDFKIISLATYKISQTTFNNDFAGRIGIKSVDNVYKAGVEIFSPGNYESFIEGGIIILITDPGDSEIIVNAQGLKIEYDLTTGSLVTPNALSENVADIMFFTLRVLNQIPLTEINLPDLYELQSARTQRLGWYLMDLTETIEFIKLLQRSSIFHYIINVDGEHTAKYYRRSTTGNEIVFRNEDYRSYTFNAGTNSVFKTVIIKYAKAAMEDNYKIYSLSEDRVSYIYLEEGTLNSDTGILTALVADEEAATIAEFYISLVERPPARVKFSTINTAALNLVPTDKIILNRSVTDDLGNEISIHEDEIYSIISRKSNHKSMTADIEAGRDNDLAGIAQYGDANHLDDHVDHSDHTDTVHADVPHSDINHQDKTTHTDTPYSDSHQDYTDYADDYLDHTDGIGHTDRVVDHNDSISQHTDTAYVDHTDHSDFHSDIPHEDGHADYTTHSDTHSDTPHIDSYL